MKLEIVHNGRTGQVIFDPHRQWPTSIYGWGARTSASGDLTLDRRTWGEPRTTPAGRGPAAFDWPVYRDQQMIAEVPMRPAWLW